MSTGRALSMLVASIQLSKVEIRQRAPLSVAEWLRLERRRKVIAKVAKTGVIPDEGTPNA